MLFFYRLDPRAVAPQRKLGGVGYDLTCIERVCIRPQETEKIRTGLSLSIPQGCYGRVAERSSTALLGLRVGGGVIDPNYTGEILIITTNIGWKTIVVEPMTRIAQLVLEKCAVPDVGEVLSLADWEQIVVQSERGDRGFGSTGM